MKNSFYFAIVLALSLFSQLVSAQQETLIHRINCGGGQVTGADNLVYESDVSNSDISFTTNSTTLTFNNVGPELEEPYRSFRLMSRNTADQFNYTFNNLQNGNYKVILHFAEPYHGVVNSNWDARRFNVDINNAQFKVDNFNIMSAAAADIESSNELDGAKKVYKMIAENLEVSNGSLVVKFTQVANDPMVNAIELFKVENTSGGGVWTKTGSNIYYNGGVGIGTDVTDGYKLVVDGSLHVKGFTLKHGGSDFVLGTNAYRSIGEKVNQRALVHDNNDVLKVNYEGDFEGGVVINGPRTMITGVVGIGNAPVPTGYKLAVNGKIIGEEVLVKLKDNWPDYVFDKAYNLPTLEEVQKHINEKGHLINIPSAAEVEANGIELGEMNKLLLEKIEEQMLYILEQQKNIENLNRRLARLENKG